MTLKFIIYFIIQSVLFISYTHQCGIIVHNEVSYRSLQLFRPLNEIEFKYKKLLSSLPSFMQAGSYFPDWGYNCLGYHEQSEDAHWAPFIKTAINYLRDTYPQPWTDLHVKGLVVFIFSIMSHDVADVKWHSLNHLEDYFIQTMSQLDFDGDFQMAHTVADTGAEFVLQHSTKVDYLHEKWQIPLNDIIQIYTRYYNSIDKPQPIPVKDHIRYCMTGAFASAQLDLSAGKYMYGTFGSKSPFLVDQLNDYHKGGLQDLSASVSHCYRDIIKSIENGVTDTLCGNYFDDQESKNIYNQIRKHHTKLKRGSLPIYNNTITIANEDELKNVEQKYGIISTWNEINGILTITTKKSLHENPKSLKNNRLVNVNTQLHKKNYLSLLQQSLKASSSQQCSSWKQNENDISSFSLASSLVGFGHATISGDFNGDNKMDIAISAPYYTDDDNHDNDGKPSLMTGAVFVLNGDQPIWQQQQIDIRNLSTTILKGNSDFGRFGTAMAVADMNRDGIDDLIVSSPFANNLIGSIDIYFGGMNGLSTKPNFQITPSHGSNGIEGFGYTLFGVDIDQDGYNDLVIGCPYCKVDNKPQAGLIEIYTSKYFNTETGLNNQEHWTIYSNSPSSYERFGTAIALTNSVLNNHAKSINGGHADDDSILVVGAPGTKANGLSQAGKVYGFDIKNIMSPTLKWFINGPKKFGQFGSVIQNWKNDILVIASPTEDTFNGLQKHWQGGSIRIYDWKTLNRGKNELIVNYGLIKNLKGQLSSGHFGSSIAFFMNKKNKDIGLWIGEPLGNHENGRLYKWTMNNSDLECLANNVNMARFGSRVINVEPDVICITSLYDSQIARSSGIIQLYKS